MSSDSPDAVRAVLEKQIKYLGDQVHRIDGDHASIIMVLGEIRTELQGMGESLRELVDTPARLERHWEFGQGVILAKWSDAAARAVGNRVMTFVFAAILAGALTWAVLRGGSGK